MASAVRVARNFRFSALSKTCLPLCRATTVRGLHHIRCLRVVPSSLTRPSAVFATPKLSVPVRFFGAEVEYTEEQIQEGTLEVVKLFDKVDASKVTLDAHFINDLGLDSLDVVELVMAFEDEFGVEISDEEAEKVFTVNDTVELLKKKLMK